MDAHLLAHAAADLPRYTSYPPANRFTAQDTAFYEAGLAQIDPQAELSLYLHVPFCRRLCWYCGCHMVVANDDGPPARYTRALLSEIDLLADRLPGRMRCSRIHFGGGTPTVLPGRGLFDVVDRLRSRFLLAEDAEIAVEIDPRTADESVIAVLADAGVTRASLGVQEFDADVQGAINRIQSYDMVARCADALYRAGIERLNLDIMYGLPRQSVAMARSTARAAARLMPDRFSVFGYAHVPWVRPHQRLIPDDTLPGLEARVAQAEAIAEVLTETGYEAVGFDHFARPEDPLAVAARTGTLRRNFQGYTDDRAEVLLGLGASAIGATPLGYVQNDPKIPAYLQAIEGGRLTCVRGYAPTPEDRLRGAMIERVLCDFALDRDAFGAAGDTVYTEALGELRRLETAGILSLHETGFTVRPEARMLVRRAAAVFDAEHAKLLSAERPRMHSKAV